MKKILYFMSAGFGTEFEEIQEFEDGATEEEIQEDFREWVFNQLDTSWHEV